MKNDIKVEHRSPQFIAKEEPEIHIDQDDAWSVIRSYFGQHGLIS